MKGQGETKEQLSKELAELRQRIAELEKADAQRKRVEVELSVAYDALASSVNGVIITDVEGKITYANPAFLKMFEYEDSDEVIGKRAAELFPSERVQKFSDVTAIVDKVKGETEEFLAQRRDGTVFPVEVSSSVVTDREGNDVGRMASFVDITEHKEMEERLVRSEKLAVLGQLAGGVGHELRNPLGAIKNAAYFLNMVLEEEETEPEVKETLEILEKEVATSEKIISSLLDFARPKPPIRRTVNVNDVVQDALSRTVVPENVEVVSQLAEALPTILADPDQLAQVFGNIILNGAQAMPEGGRLTVKTWQVSEEKPARSGQVAVSVTDTGVGISEEHLERVFEPLFTTKAKGIGLGLAVTRTLVEGHGGSIGVQSEVGKGSTFTVRLSMSRRGEK